MNKLRNHLLLFLHIGINGPRPDIKTYTYTKLSLYCALMLVLSVILTLVSYEKQTQITFNNLWHAIDYSIKNETRLLENLYVIVPLVMLAGWFYYNSYISKRKRILTEKENEKLKLEKKSLKLEISRLKSERDNLKKLQKEQSELAKPVQNVIKIRLKILNGLLAKEITNNESYATSYYKLIKTIHNDKKKFMDSTRLAFAASSPKFMKFLEQHGLSTDEINYLCLYAIGLRGKEIGEYMQLKRHYIMSHEIRKKLGINEHETNIGLYVCRLKKMFGE